MSNQKHASNNYYTHDRDSWNPVNGLLYISQVTNNRGDGKIPSKTMKVLVNHKGVILKKVGLWFIKCQL